MIARLPIKDALVALALHTAGWPSTPQTTHHVDEGTTHLTYWVDGDANGAQAVLDAMADTDPAKNLQRRDPTHRFLASRHAVEAYGVLSRWLDGAAMAPPAVVLTYGPLRRVLPEARADYDLQRVVWHGGLQPAVRVSCPCFATALAVCGFPFWPALLPPGQGKPAALAFAEESLSFPGLTHTILAGYVQRTIQADPLPGTFTLGEHPFDYAYQAAINASRHPLFLRQAAGHSQIFLKGPGTGGIIASQSLFEESNPNSTFRDQAWEFLSGE